MESPRYQLTESEDTIAACLGHAYKAAQTKHADASDAVWDVKNRIALELSLARPTFNSDVFIERIQYWYERADGF